MSAEPIQPSLADSISAMALTAAVVAGAMILGRAIAALDPWWSIPAAAGIVASALGGWFDLRQRKVPNALTLPLMTLALTLAGVRVALGRWGLAEVGAIALIWAVCLAAWLLRLFGGGDAKLAMGLLGLVPVTGSALGVLLGLLAGGLIYLTVGPHPDGWSRFQRTVWVILARRAPPSRADVADAYRRRANPAAPWIGVGFCLYVAIGLLPFT